MGNYNRISPVVVVHKKPRKNGKVFIEVFENVRVDDIISTTKESLMFHTNIKF